MNNKEILEVFFIEMMEETYEGNLLKEYLEDKKSTLTRVQIQELFNGVLYHTPENYSYLLSVKDLFRDEDSSAFDRTDKLKEILLKPYQEMIKRKFFESINLDLNDYKENEIYIHFNNGSEPTNVVFLKVNQKYLNFCDIYDLKSDKIFSVNLTSLIPFNFDNYKKLLKEWRINYHKSVLENLEK